MYQFIFYITISILATTEYFQLSNADILLEEGALIYNEGRSLSNRDIRATYLNKDVSSKTIACVQCHGARGKGGIDESGITIPPIDRMSIENKIKSITNKVIVDSTTLNRIMTKAISTGVGLDGKPLHLLMPRYKLTLDEMKSLLVYIENLERIE